MDDLYVFNFITADDQHAFVMAVGGLGDACVGDRRELLEKPGFCDHCDICVNVVDDFEKMSLFFRVPD